jgi:hypothetical protein
LLWLGLNETITGKIVLAVIDDRDISGAMGVNVTASWCFIPPLAMRNLGRRRGIVNGGGRRHYPRSWPRDRAACRISSSFLQP